MKQILGFFKRASAGAVVFAAVASASAQASNHVAWSKIETGPWIMHTIYTEDAAGGRTVGNFLALTDPNAAVGDNLIAVWYQRSESGWTTKSWTTADPWEAIKAVKGQLGIPDDEDDRWDLSGSDEGIVAPETPKDYTEGVLADDPLASLVASSPNRDAIIEFLAGFGYKAADVPVEKGDGCATDTKLDGMAAAMVETLRGDEETAVERSMQAWIASGTANCGVGTVAVAVVTFPPVWTPWSLPAYLCTTSQFLFQCATQTWTETSTAIQKRTRSAFNPAPPPTYLYCDQTRTITKTRTTTCKICVALLSPSVACPAAPPPGSPVPSGCLPGWTKTGPVIDEYPGTWAPPCPSPF